MDVTARCDICHTLVYTYKNHHCHSGSGNDRRNRNTHRFLAGAIVVWVILMGVYVWVL